MAVIAKVSIGQFTPGDELKGLSDERVAELLDAGFAEHVDSKADVEQAPKSKSGKKE